MSKKCLHVERLIDPDWGCTRGRCPYLGYDVEAERIVGGRCLRSDRPVCIDATEAAYYEPAPPWCELRKLPDAAPGEGYGVHDTQGNRTESTSLGDGS